MQITGLTAVFCPSIGDVAFNALAEAAGVTNPYPAPLSTPISTAGAGTLTAAAIIGGLITRTGPTAAFTDTFDTTANIIAALASDGVPFESGYRFAVAIKNATAFLQTFAAGDGSQILPLTIINGGFQTVSFIGTLGGTSAAPTITWSHLESPAIALATGVINPKATALNTVGAGIITAASIASGIVTRGGSQNNTAFTDTTDTAANIIAANPGLIGKIGSSALYIHENTTNATETITGGLGVTVSGYTTVPGNGWAIYLLTYTAAATITMVGIASGGPTTSNGTFVANGATAVVVADTRITANSTVKFGLKTIGGTPAGAPFMSAVTPGTGFSVKVAAGDTSTYNYAIEY